jgi:hypothetical protein
MGRKTGSKLCSLAQVRDERDCTSIIVGRKESDIPLL